MLSYLHVKQNLYAISPSRALWLAQGDVHFILQDEKFAPPSDQLEGRRSGREVLCVQSGSVALHSFAVEELKTQLAERFAASLFLSFGHWSL
jgi:hypothetical protein